MKKWMIYGLIGTLAACLAVAEDTVPWYKKLFTQDADEQTQVIPPAPEAQVAPTEPATATPVPVAPASDVKQKAAGDRPQPTPEQMEKMKAQHDELMKMGEAARNETDPANKEILVGQLRVKLTEIADKMQADAKKRLDQVEKELPKLKGRVADYENNKAARIEDQVQRILAGQPLAQHEGKRPDQSAAGKAKKAPKAPSAE